MNVKQVDISSTTGNFGILPNHVPAISVLKPGVVAVYEGDKIHKFFGTFFLEILLAYVGGGQSRNRAR